MSEPSSHSGASHHPPAHSATPGAPRDDGDSLELEPLETLDEVDELAGEAPAPVAEKKIKAFGVAGTHKVHTYKRTPHQTGQGSVRVKTFHGKLSDQGMSYLDDAVNDWLDAHPEVEVKFVTSTVGVFEGKIREPALVLNVWY